jgi:hypothetical protein
MEIFNIELTKKIRQGNDLFYVEFVPQNEYDDVVKKCDAITSEQITDYLYLEKVKTELYNLLSEMYGTEFTDKYEL